MYTVCCVAHAPGCRGGGGAVQAPSVCLASGCAWVQAGRMEVLLRMCDTTPEEIRSVVAQRLQEKAGSKDMVSASGSGGGWGDALAACRGCHVVVGPACLAAWLRVEPGRSGGWLTDWLRARRLPA